MGRKLRPGEALQGIPHGQWNAFDDAAEFVQGLQNPTNGDKSGKATNGQLPVLVKLHESLPAYSVVKIELDLSSEPNKLQLGRPPLLEAGDPEEGELFAITAVNGEEGQSVPATLFGQTWVKVDIQDEADTTCGVVDSDTTKLISGEGSTKIISKESGTGEKWASVLLGAPGEAGGGTDVGYAWVVEDVHKAINTMATTDRTPGNVIVTGEMSLGGEVPADTDDPSVDGTLAVKMTRKYTEDPTGIPNWELIYYVPPPEHDKYEEIKLYGFVGASTRKDRVVVYAVIDGKHVVIAEDCY